MTRQVDDIGKQQLPRALLRVLKQGRLYPLSPNGRGGSPGYSVRVFGPVLWNFADWDGDEKDLDILERQESSSVMYFI